MRELLLNNSEKDVSNKVIIYGAGMVGNLVRHFFEINNIAERICAVAVSEEPDIDYMWGYRYECIDNLIDEIRECLVIVATFPEHHSLIVNRLKSLGANRIYTMNFESYQQFAKEYMDYYVENHLLNDFYDILYFPSDNNCTSGAFLSLVNLVQDINKRGLKTLVILPEYGNGEELLMDNDIEYTFVPSNTWLKRLDGKALSWQQLVEVDNYKAIKRIEKIIEECEVKLVHCNTTYTYVGAKAAQNKKIPVVWHLREKTIEQGYIYDDEKEFYSLINSSDQIITVSQYIKDNYEKLDRNKTVIIYNGIDVDRYYNQHLVFDNPIIKIIMPGAIYPLKRQKDLVEAVALLKKKSISVSVDIVGTGEVDYVKELKSIVEKNQIQSQINFMGKRNHLEELYKQYDIVVSCSGVESFGRVCVEGQLSGCLVIGANSGGTLEIIKNKENGLLFDYQNSKSLADTIEYAIKNVDEMRKIALSGQKYAMEHLNKEYNSKQIYEIYRNLIKVGE